MTKRSLSEAKPWCWYCNREFDDDKVLIQHQKAKHFKCFLCSKKLNSAPSMVIHIAQVHKQPITRVPNALEGRDDVRMQIFGMQGVPVEDLVQHYVSAGAEPEPILKRIREESQSYAHGPGALTRAPGISAVTGIGLAISTAAASSDPSKSTHLGLPPPLLARSSSGKPNSLVSSISVSKDSISPTELVTNLSNESFADDSSDAVQSINSSCSKSINKTCILVYSCAKSIEQRRIDECFTEK